MTDTVTAAPIADVQNSRDNRQIPIDKVGIKDIRHPVRVKDRSSGEQHTIANFNMYVNLPHNFKGTHMSRFVEILNQHEREISVDSFKEMLSEMTDRLEAEAGHIEMTRPFPSTLRSDGPPRIFHTSWPSAARTQYKCPSSLAKYTLSCHPAGGRRTGPPV